MSVELQNWTVRDRYGWGWTVDGPTAKEANYIQPLSSASACEAYCAVRNAGGTHEDGWKAARAAGGQTKDEYTGR